MSQILYVKIRDLQNYGCCCCPFSPSSPLFPFHVARGTKEREDEEDDKPDHEKQNLKSFLLFHILSGYLLVVPSSVPSVARVLSRAQRETGGDR